MDHLSSKIYVTQGPVLFILPGNLYCQSALFLRMSEIFSDNYYFYLCPLWHLRAIPYLTTDFFNVFKLWILHNGTSGSYFWETMQYRKYIYFCSVDWAVPYTMLFCAENHLCKRLCGLRYNCTASWYSLSMLQYEHRKSQSQCIVAPVIILCTAPRSRSGVLEYTYSHESWVTAKIHRCALSYIFR